VWEVEATLPVSGSPGECECEGTCLSATMVDGGGGIDKEKEGERTPPREPPVATDFVAAPVEPLRKQAVPCDRACICAIP